MIIRAIVYAKNKEDALDEAEKVFERLSGDNYPFDYYCMFRKTDAGHGVSGSDRWGNLPDAAEVTSKEGKQLIDEGMKYTKDEFMRGMEVVRKAVDKYTDEELFNEDVISKDKDEVGLSFKYYCHCIGAYDGSEVYLYNEEAEGIRSEKDLKDALEQYGTPDKDLKVYVVPADVHY